MWVQAWAFIIAREVEAPQRFQAIQSHRAAQALLHQQTQYVAHLLDTAVVDEEDGHHLLRSAAHPTPKYLTPPHMDAALLCKHIQYVAHLLDTVAVHKGEPPA